MRAMKDSGIEWIGQIPQEWSVGKTIFGLEMPITDGPHETPQLYSEGIPFVSAEAVSTGDGKINFDNIRGYISREYYEECCKKYVPRKEDIYMIKSGATTGKVAIVDTDDIFTIWSPLAVFRCNKDSLNSRFLLYTLQSDYFQTQVESKWSLGTQQNIGMRTLERLLICYPSIGEQERIAEYLDTKCADIDALIAAKEKTNSLLKERRQSIIYEAVTKGLNPDAPMKDSGIEWIGEIPEHWERISLKYCIQHVGSGTSVNAEDRPANTDEMGVLKTSCVSSGAFVAVENKTILEGEHDRASCPVKADTVIVSRMNTPDLVGACGYVEEDYPNLYLPDRLWQVEFSEDCVAKYMWYFLTSKYVRNYYTSVCTGTSGSMQNISQDQFGAIVFFKPAKEEQQRIVEQLDLECNVLTQLLRINELSLSKLKEYRQSIIYEAVTGKIEV